VAAFGNLIAFAAAKAPRELGNSVFLSENFEPYPDQWAYLSTVQRMSRHAVESLVRSAEANRSHHRCPPRIIGRRRSAAMDAAAIAKSQGCTGGWPFAGSVELVLADANLHAKAALSPGLRNRLIQLAAFQNPGILQSPGDCACRHTTSRALLHAQKTIHRTSVCRVVVSATSQDLLSGLKINMWFVTKGLRLAIERGVSRRVAARASHRGACDSGHDTRYSCPATTAFGKPSSPHG